jgi:alkanesulfonate monooxygenase SsuD/methylene tetrahydromethanopterin reductase-like flavin-dependent oxidoreductase (luciferase family)
MNTPLFGANVDPAVSSLSTAFEIAQLADENDLDMVMMQDHPYNKDHLDTWTLLTTLAARTRRVHVGTNVANVPLRTPAMLAKMAASLDVISGGRVELGVGAGYFWRGIRAYGGRQDIEAKPFTAFQEALAIMRGMWDHSGSWGHSGSGFKFQGEIYEVAGAVPGPAPAHHIRLWVGGYGPKMLHLIGETADGVSLSSPYAPYRQLAGINRQIDAGAAAAGRSPDAVRRMYNMMGVITDHESSNGFEDKAYTGSRQQWIDHLTMLHRDYRVDTFVFWPTEGDPIQQMRIYATEIAPAIKAAAV